MLTYVAYTILYVTSKILLCKSKPDILTLSQSWLDNSVLDNEFALADYSLHRKDRNCHGGGIAMYLKSSLSYGLHATLKKVRLRKQKAPWLDRELCKMRW